MAAIPKNFVNEHFGLMTPHHSSLKTEPFASTCFHISNTDKYGTVAALIPNFQILNQFKIRMF